MEEKLYKFEVQTMKDGSTAVSPTATYTNAKDAEVAFHNAVAYNLQSTELASFLVMIISETGAVDSGLRRFYNFAVEEEQDV